MSASVHLGDIGLYVDMLGLFLGIVGFVLACWAAVALSRKRWRRFVFAASACVATWLPTASQVWVARPEVWVEVAAVYDSAEPVLRTKMAADLKHHWLWSDDIRVSSWIVLSERWGVCHDLWPQPRCLRPSGERLPMGFARERLASIARGA